MSDFWWGFLCGLMAYPIIRLLLVLVWQFIGYRVGEFCELISDRLRRWLSLISAKREGWDVATDTREYERGRNGNNTYFFPISVEAKKWCEVNLKHLNRVRKWYVVSGYKEFRRVGSELYEHGFVKICSCRWGKLGDLGPYFKNAGSWF